MIFTLNTKSSYKQDIQKKATEKDYDTLQWLISPDKIVRVRTFSLDNDIHISEIDRSFGYNKIMRNSADYYGDIITKQVEIEFSSKSDPDEIRSALAEQNMKGSLEFSKDPEMVFWNYDSRVYRTISEVKPLKRK